MAKDKMTENITPDNQIGMMADVTVQPKIYATEIPPQLRDDGPRIDKTRPGGLVVKKTMDNKFIVVDSENRQIPGLLYDTKKRVVVEATE